MKRFKHITDQDLRDAGWKQYIEGSRGVVWRHSVDHPQVAADGLQARLIYWIDQYENETYVAEDALGPDYVSDLDQI